MRSRTKHINVKFHHFRDYVKHRKSYFMPAINTHNQPADMLTKLLAAPTLAQHHATIMGWGGKGNAERECEDIHLRGSQQCHKPARKPSGTKSTQGHSTRPQHKVAFSQSGPTTIRPDLNNFSA